MNNASISYFFNVLHETSQTKFNYTFGLFSDQLETLNCDTLRECGGTREISLVPMMGQQCLQLSHVYNFVRDH